MKYLLVGLVVVALVVPVPGAGCGSETPANENGENIPLQPGVTTVLPTPTPPPATPTPTPVMILPEFEIVGIERNFDEGWGIVTVKNVGYVAGEAKVSFILGDTRNHDIRRTRESQARIIEPGEEYEFVTWVFFHDYEILLTAEIEAIPLYEGITFATPTPITTDVTTIQVPFLYRADEFDLKVVVPNRLTLSTPDDKKAYPVDIYIKKKQDVGSLGFFDRFEISVTLEVGVNVRLSLLTGVSCHVFFDTDLVIFGEKRPDVISLEWPIPGCFWGTGGLEAGDLGVSAFAIPVTPPQGDLSSLPLGTWSYVGSYNMYVVRPYSLDVLATSLSGEVVRIP